MSLRWHARESGLLPPFRRAKIGAPVIALFCCISAMHRYTTICLVSLCSTTCFLTNWPSCQSQYWMLKNGKIDCKEISIENKDWIKGGTHSIREKSVYHVVKQVVTDLEANVVMDGLTYDMRSMKLRWCWRSCCLC